jgi:hypothetical protein
MGWLFGAHWLTAHMAIPVFKNRTSSILMTLEDFSMPSPVDAFPPYPACGVCETTGGGMFTEPICAMLITRFQITFIFLDGKTFFCGAIQIGFQSANFHGVQSSSGRSCVFD